MIFPIISDRYRLGYWIWWKLAALYYRILRSSSDLSTLYKGAPSPLSRLLPQSESHGSESLEHGIQILQRFRPLVGGGTSLCWYREDRFNRQNRPVQCPLLLQIPHWSDDGHQIHNGLSIATRLLTVNFLNHTSNKNPQSKNQVQLAKPGQAQI